jgi:hypothetical protein
VERFCLFQKILNKTKTYGCVPTSFLQKQNVSIFSKNFGTKPKLFDVLQFFFSKSKTLLYNRLYIFDFFGDVGGKTKASDL